MPSIWIHAVSVGEVLATRALIPALRERYPEHRLFLSTTTETGRSVAASIDALDGVFYSPVDLASVVGRVLDQVQPVLVVMVDTETLVQPVQPGNSGGPFVYEGGDVVATAAAPAFIRATDSIPQNINWAVKSAFASVLFEPPPADRTPSLDNPLQRPPHDQYPSVL